MLGLMNSLKEDTLKTLKGLTKKEITHIIQEANHKYYNGEEPLFSDNIYDLIWGYLKEVDPENKILSKVGSDVKGKKEKLPYTMASLDKVKGEGNSLQRFVKNYPGQYIISDKLDGNSAMFMIKNGERKLWSRGDGKNGQNLSHLIPHIKNLCRGDVENEITVRGEMIISKKNFLKVKEKFANPRNMVAGILNTKKPDPSLLSKIDFIAYELIAPNIIPDKALDYIKNLRFEVVWHSLIDKNNFTSEYLSDLLIKRRNTSPYEVDGIVINHNKIHPRVPDNPKYAFAFKSIINAKEAEVIVSGVEWNISKDKRIIPVVTFLPVNLNGVNIQRATAHNAKFINDNIIGPGSKIIIIRGGEIIPTIIKILTSSETKKPSMPDYEYVWGESGVDIYITDDNNNQLALKNLEYFFKKLEIEGLGPGNIKKLSDAGFKSPKSILNINKDELLTVEGFKDKIAIKLYQNIKERNKNLDCLLLMSASNTIGSGIGVRKVKMVTDVLPQIVTHRYIPNVQELVKIKGIEMTTAELFVKGLPKFWNFIDVNSINCSWETSTSTTEPKNTTISTTSHLFNGQKIVFTGFRNKEWEKIIENNGGEISTSVSGKTSLVVCKGDEEKTSGKAQKALDLGITVLSKNEFIDKYNI